MAYKLEFHPEAEAEFDEEGETAFIHAIFHQKRDPQIWQVRTREN